MMMMDQTGWREGRWEIRVVYSVVIHFKCFFHPEKCTVSLLLFLACFFVRVECIYLLFLGGGGRWSKG